MWWLTHQVLNDLKGQVLSHLHLNLFIPFWEMVHPLDTLTYMFGGLKQTFSYVTFGDAFKRKQENPRSSSLQGQVVDWADWRVEVVKAPSS